MSEIQTVIHNCPVCARPTGEMIAKGYNGVAYQTTRYCRCGWSEGDGGANAQPRAVFASNVVQPRAFSWQTGFSLLEVAISMIFYGLLIAGVAAAAKVDRAEQNQKVNPERLATITTALEQYRTENGFYPCPALPSAPVGTADHGRPGDCTAPWSMSGFGCDADGVCVKAGRLYDHDDNPSTDPVPMRVREGAIPTTALNLPSSVAGDTYGRQFRYAVAEVLAADKPTYSKYESLGGIDIVTAANVSALDTPESTRFAVFGLGADGRGGYVHGSGRAYLPCIADRMDSVNCDQSNSAKAVYRTASRAIPNDITAANYFDDFIEWQKPKAASASTLTVSNQPYVDFSGTCAEGYDVAYTGRQMVFGLVVSAKRPTSSGGVSEYTSPQTEPHCVHTDAFKAKKVGNDYLPHPDGTFSVVNNSATPWGSVKAGSVCAVCVGSAL